MSFTVKELIEELKSYEQDKEVFVQDLQTGVLMPLDSTGFNQKHSSIVLYLEEEDLEDDAA